MLEATVIHGPDGPTIERRTDAEIHKIALSHTVDYVFTEHAGVRSDERMVASRRWYPGILYDGHFYSGLHHGNRFLPGIMWWGRFIPGLLTRRGFTPGLAINDRFTPGVIVAGVFLPGILRGDMFVPGVVRQNAFVPGCFTAERKFAPGRFLNDGFQAGVFDDRQFVPSKPTALLARELDRFAEQGYAMRPVRRFDRLGGLTLRGIVVGGTPKQLMMVPYGFASDWGIVIGGTGRYERLPVLDPMTELGKLGFTSKDPSDLLGAGQRLEQAQQWLDELLPDMSTGSTSAQTWTQVDEALDVMGRGVNALMDALNQGWADYWNELFGGNPGGMVAGGDSRGDKSSWRYAGGVVGWAVGGIVGGILGAGSGTVVGGGPVGTGIGAGMGMAAGMETGVDVGAQVGEWIGDAVEAIGDAASSVWHAIFGSSEKSNQSKGSATSAPEEPGGVGDAGLNLVTDKPVPPLMPDVNMHKTTIAFDTGQQEFDPTSQWNVYAAPVRIIETDTGAMAIVNQRALAQAIQRAPDHRVFVGLNPLTGDAMYEPGQVSDAELAKATQIPWWGLPVAHPMGPQEA